MTKHECAIVMAYTGIAMLQGKDLDIFYRYAEEKLGHPVWTHEFVNLETIGMLEAASKKDFMDLCKNATDE